MWWGGNTCRTYLVWLRAPYCWTVIITSSYVFDKTVIPCLWVCLVWGEPFHWCLDSKFLLSVTSGEECVLVIHNYETHINIFDDPAYFKSLFILFVFFLLLFLTGFTYIPIISDDLSLRLVFSFLSFSMYSCAIFILYYILYIVYHANKQY